MSNFSSNNLKQKRLTNEILLPWLNIFYINYFIIYIKIYDKKNYAVSNQGTRVT